MRITLAITIVATLALAAWWNYPTLAGSKQAPVVSIDPLHMMTTVTELPAQGYDAY
jgi:hypothetical protein